MVCGGGGGAAGEGERGGKRTMLANWALESKLTWIAGETAAEEEGSESTNRDLQGVSPYASWTERVRDTITPSDARGRPLPSREAGVSTWGPVSQPHTRCGWTLNDGSLRAPVLRASDRSGTSPSAYCR